MDDAPIPRWSLAVAALVIGGLLALSAYFAFLVPNVPKALPQTAALRLHTPTPDGGALAEREYREQLASSLETVAFEIDVISTGVKLADYKSPRWQAMMADAAISLQRECDYLSALTPPAHMRTVHGNVLKMAEHFGAGARTLLRGSGWIDASKLNSVAAEFRRGADYLDLVASYQW